MTLNLSQLAQGGDSFRTPVIQTGNYTAVAWDVILADTSSIGAFTVTLPAAPSTGDSVRIIDNASNFAIDNLTVDPNSLKIRGTVENLTCDIDNVIVTLTYTGATNGWVFDPPNGGNPLASTTVRGVVELATGAESITGTDGIRAVTPAGLKSVTDTLSEWNTPTAETTAYTAVASDIVLADTATTAAFTVTLPAAPSIGDQIKIHDSKGNFATDNLTIASNSLKIRGSVQNITCDIDWMTIELIYTGTTDGWLF